MSSSEPSRARISGKSHSIRYDQTQAFLDTRADKASNDPLTATMYQDATLATRRDEFEKQTVLPLLHPRANDRVLDLGCGAGRWARALAPVVDRYLGIDFSQKLLDAAAHHNPGVSFQCMRVDALDVSAFKVPPPFTVVLCSGIFAYINDADLIELFAKISQIAAPASRVYVREPVAKVARLTLDEYWSEELQSAYSVIYRTRDEYLAMFQALSGFHVVAETAPFPAELQNRAETEQHCFVLERLAEL
jgi:SAM-dependent methyltransferase